MVGRVQRLPERADHSGHVHVVYSSPIYRKPVRKEHNYIGSIDFESEISAKHWAMRGVALLCDIK